MNDAMKMGDGVAIGLECGHPNKEEGEFCENCGHIVHRNQVADAQKESAGQGLNEQATKEPEDGKSSVRPEDGGPGLH